MGRKDVGRYEMAGRVARAMSLHLRVADAFRQHDPGELGVELENPVLVEHPVDRIVVVADRGDEKDDEFARAA